MYQTIADVVQKYVLKRQIFKIYSWSQILIENKHIPSTTCILYILGILLVIIFTIHIVFYRVRFLNKYPLMCHGTRVYLYGPVR